MPEDAPTSTKKSTRQNSGTKDEKVIDNMVLAAILRTSADVVERGEFDAILYDALTDFRVYYKQKYPKTKSSKDKSTKDKHSKKKSSKKQSSSSSAVATATTGTEIHSTTKTTSDDMEGNSKTIRSHDDTSTVESHDHVVETKVHTATTSDAATNDATSASKSMPFDESPSFEQKQHQHHQPQQQPYLSISEQQEEIRRQVETQLAEEKAKILDAQTLEIQRLVDEQLQQRLEVEMKEYQIRYDELLATTIAAGTTPPTNNDHLSTVHDNPEQSDDTHVEPSGEYQYTQNEGHDTYDQHPNPPVETAVPVSQSGQYPTNSTHAQHASQTSDNVSSNGIGSESADYAASHHSHTNSTGGGASRFRLGKVGLGAKIPFKPKAINPFKRKNHLPSKDDVGSEFVNDLSRQAVGSGRRKAMDSHNNYSDYHATSSAGGTYDTGSSQTDELNPIPTVEQGIAGTTSTSSETPSHDQTPNFGTSFSSSERPHNVTDVDTKVPTTPVPPIHNYDDENNDHHDTHYNSTQPSGDVGNYHNRDDGEAFLAQQEGLEGGDGADTTFASDLNDHPSSGISHRHEETNSNDIHTNTSKNYSQPNFESSDGNPPSVAVETEDSLDPDVNRVIPGVGGGPPPQPHPQNSSSLADGTMEPSIGDSRPSFQQPVNKNSALIANGWIEQFRRSKFRHVWKVVLASLVEARHPGEETTLWIQREYVDSDSGETKLEALEQVAMKNLEEIKLNEMATDNQFTLKLYNATDEFVFRCNDSPVDAMRWVTILKNHQKIARGMSIARGEMSNKSAGSASPFEEEKKGPDAPSSAAHGPTSASSNQNTTLDTGGLSIRELRAICHGAGINTAGMERGELVAAADGVRRRGTYFPPAGSSGAPPTHRQQTASQQAQHNQGHPSHYDHPQYAQPNHSRSESVGSGTNSQKSYGSQQQQLPEQRLTATELKAICHGAGINTAGMERRELEAAAEEVRKRGTYFNPPPGMHAPTADEARRQAQAAAAAEDERRRRAAEEEARRRHQAEEEARRRSAAEEEARRRRLAEEEARRKAAAEEEARRRKAEEEARRRHAEEEARRRAAVEEARRRQAEEEHRRRLAAEAEQRRQQQEAQERYRQQQAAWQHQQQEEEIRRRRAEHEAAELRRRHDEALKNQQKWASPSPNPQRPNATAQQQQHHYQHSHQQTHGHQYPQQPPHPQSHPHQPRSHPQQQGHVQQQPQQQQQQRQSAASNKYAGMANQSDDDGQAVITRIKHDILIRWALQPPQLQMLRPIDALLTSIHTVFPPALGVAGHEYFSKYKPFAPDDLKGTNGLPEMKKLKKAVLKLKFFLHPDKLPRDLNEEQAFVVKMLWDVTSDAWEEFQKHAEQLDWIHN